MGLSPARERWILDTLGRRLGRKLERGPEPAALDEIKLPPAKLTSELTSALRAACGDEHVRSSQFERLTHALGKSFPDLLRLRSGDVGVAPDIVVYPPDEGAVAAVLRLAVRERLAVVPVGGGTSVVGGIEPSPGEAHSGVIALDTTRLDAMVRIDAESHLATFQAGIDGPALEHALSGRGFTLGHYPQSFEHSTLGGWIATRSSGQFSNRYGAIESLLAAVRVVTPEGVLRSIEVPRSAAGPDLNQLVLGSEGTLGVVVEATLRVRPLPLRSDVRAMLFESFQSGVALVREVQQGGLPTSMLRLSDGDESELFEMLRHDPARRFDLSARALQVLSRWGYGPGRCVLLYGVEGDGAEVRRVQRALRKLARRQGAIPLGAAPGRSWRRDRFRTPYLRDWLLDHGVAVDTLETALPWCRVSSGHEQIKRTLRAALERQAGAGLAMAHLSHSYRDGASLYFTLLYPVDEANARAQWQAIKRDATDAVVAAGGTLSHHHGVGADHAPWMAEEKGSVGMTVLRGAKQAVDPVGVMNPGKLIS